MSESYDAPPTAMTDRDYRIREAEKAAHQYANLGKACEEPYKTQAPACGPPQSEDFTLHNIDAAMKYQPWNPFQCEQGDQVREALTLAAKVILRNCPPGRFRSVALCGIINARMNANAAISFQGRF